MKFFFSIFALSQLAFSMTSIAGPETFAGAWQGKGTYILNGDLTQCSEFRMVFSASSNTFVFESGHRVCDKHSEQFYRVPMQFGRGVITFDGQEVGTYSENKMDVQFSVPDSGGRRNWRMSMRRQGDHIVYEESRTMNEEKTPLISFSGLMILQK